MDPITIWTAVGACAAVVAAIGAITYAERQHRLVRLEHTPALRLAPAFVNGTLDPRRAIIKNVGRGPALGIFLVDAAGAIQDFQVSGLPHPAWDVIDPPTGGPVKERMGRQEIEFVRPLSLSQGAEFVLWYQDLEGDWHRTHARWVNLKFRHEFRGRTNLTEVPNVVACQAHVKPSSPA